MADVTLSANVDSFLTSANKAEMRAAMDLTDAAIAGYVAASDLSAILPTTNPGSGKMWLDSSGALVVGDYTGVEVTSGSIATALGYTPANDSLVVHLAGSETITGPMIIESAVPQLTLKGTVSNAKFDMYNLTGNYWSLLNSNTDHSFRWMYNGGTAFYMNNSKQVEIGGGTNPSAQFQVVSKDASTITQILKGYTDQTANIFETRSSSNTVGFSIASGGTAAINGATVSSTVGLIVKAPSSQDAIAWQANTSTTTIGGLGANGSGHGRLSLHLSTGTRWLDFMPSGSYFNDVLSVGGSTVDTTKQLQVISQGATKAVLSLKGATSQSGNFIQMYTSLDIPKAIWDSNGFLTIYNAYTDSTNYDSPGRVYWSGNTFIVGTLASVGTGNARHTNIISNGVNRIVFQGTSNRYTSATASGSTTATAHTFNTSDSVTLFEILGGGTATFSGSVRFVNSSNYIDASSGNFRIYSGDGTLAWQAGSSTITASKAATFSSTLAVTGDATFSSNIVMTADMKVGTSSNYFLPRTSSFRMYAGSSMVVESTSSDYSVKPSQNYQVFTSSLVRQAIDINGNTTFSPVWNNVATTFTGLLVNATDTASASASLLQDWQVGGVSVASMSKAGALTTPKIAFSGTTSTDYGFFGGTGSRIAFGRFSTSAAHILISSGSTGSIVLNRNGYLYWSGSTSSAAGGGTSAGVRSAAAGVVEITQGENSSHALGTLQVATVENPGAVLNLGNSTYGVKIATPTPPATAASTGTAGQVAWDADYIYICTATDTWKRATLTTW
jgi:hypothetical protein